MAFIYKLYNNFNTTLHFRHLKRTVTTPATTVKRIQTIKIS